MPGVGRNPNPPAGWAALAAVLAVLTAAPSAGAVTDATAIANLNAQRSANGIPAEIAVDPALSSACQKHNNYMFLNRVTTHDEIPGSPGFTPDGQVIGQMSVVASGVQSWAAPEANPFERAPIHLAQVLDPAMQVSGFDESLDYSCLVTHARPRRPAAGRPRVLTYPGPGTRIYRSEVAEEIPYTPGDLIGIPPKTATGPYLYVFVVGAGDLDQARIVKATLRRAGKGKKGRSVKVERIDGTNPQLGPFIPAGGMVIPVKPLAPGRYRAKVEISAAGRKLKKSWSFRADG